MGKKLSKFSKEHTCSKLLEETPEAYYWAGFITADGCISHNNYCLSVELSSKDSRHLKKLSSLLKVPIRTRIRSLKYKGTSKNFKMVSIQKTDMVFVKKLSEKFDLKPHKTFHPPKKLQFNDKNMFLAFLIGYIDGDGSISQYNSIGTLGKRTCSYRCTIECHKSWKPFLKYMLETLYSYYGDSLIQPNNVYISNRGYALTSIGNQNILRFLKLKIKELGIPALNRKWGIIPDIKIKSDRQIVSERKTAIIKKYINKYKSLSATNIYKILDKNEKEKIDIFYFYHRAKDIKNGII